MQELDVKNKTDPIIHGSNMNKDLMIEAVGEALEEVGAFHLISSEQKEKMADVLLGWYDSDREMYSYTVPSSKDLEDNEIRRLKEVLEKEREGSRQREWIYRESIARSCEGNFDAKDVYIKDGHVEIWPG